MKTTIKRDLKDRLINKIDSNALATVLDELDSLLDEYYASDVDHSKVNADLLRSFISSKRLEGCSERTLSYYQSTIEMMMAKVDMPLTKMSTEDIRQYLSDYQSDRRSSKITIDNIRRIFSSFFSWLEDEEYIVKSPIRRIHKVKFGRTVKDTFTDEELEQIRDSCDNVRNLAIIDILISTGIRVGELVRLNKADIDFTGRECVVFGKGESERLVYFDARTKLHLQEYISQRNDDDPALFVTLHKPTRRLSINGVETMLKSLEESTHIDNIHPHKFRRTMATRAIDKGMPIEQVQRLLGHVRIDTTLHYAMVNQENVKNAHKKYVA